MESEPACGSVRVSIIDDHDVVHAGGGAWCSDAPTADLGNRQLHNTGCISGHKRGTGGKHWTSSSLTCNSATESPSSARYVPCASADSR